MEEKSRAKKALVEIVEESGKVKAKLTLAWKAVE